MTIQFISTTSQLNFQICPSDIYNVIFQKVLFWSSWRSRKLANSIEHLVLRDAAVLICSLHNPDRVKDPVINSPEAALLGVSHFVNRHSKNIGLLGLLSVLYIPRSVVKLILRPYTLTRMESLHQKTNQHSGSCCRAMILRSSSSLERHRLWVQY